VEDSSLCVTSAVLSCLSLCGSTGSKEALPECAAVEEYKKDASPIHEQVQLIQYAVQEYRETEHGKKENTPDLERPRNEKENCGDGLNGRQDDQMRTQGIFFMKNICPQRRSQALDEDDNPKRRVK